VGPRGGPVAVQKRLSRLWRPVTVRCSDGVVPSHRDTGAVGGNPLQRHVAPTHRAVAQTLWQPTF
jgi:hypothetical protein